VVTKLGGVTAPARGNPAARKSAGERREQILAIAVRQFAEAGYRGASTEAIAREAGISQPYLFQLFGTKCKLFLACGDRAADHVASVFRRAAEGVPREERLHRMGRAYVEELLPERHEILLLLQSYAAASDPAIQVQVRRRFGELLAEVAALAEVEPAEAVPFFAHGMLLNVIAALDMGGEDWAAAWMGG
jgi:AcrR family transcriptional regulator